MKNIEFAIQKELIGKSSTHVTNQSVSQTQFQMNIVALKSLGPTTDS